MDWKRIHRGRIFECSLICAVLVTFACSNGENPVRELADTPDDPALRTDAEGYVLVRDDRGWGTNIPFTLTNAAPDTLYAVNCNGATTIGLEKKYAAGWSVVWAPITNACLSPPIMIAPGETLGDTVVLWGAPSGGNVGPEFADTSFDGRYRLVWWNLVFHYTTRGSAFGDSVPLRYKTSNEFTLTAPPNDR